MANRTEKIDSVEQTAGARKTRVEVSNPNRLILKPTGIVELDILLRGGIPKGHAILLSGNAGTGKTILAMQWLLIGYTKFKEPGVYLTMTEPVSKAMRNLQQMSFFEVTAMHPLKIHLCDLRTIVKLLNEDTQLDKRDCDKILKIIENIIKKSNAKRLVIDSITAMGQMLKDNDTIRYFVFQLCTMIENLGCTTILTSEVGDHGFSKFGVEEFVADGILKLSYEVVHGDLARSAQIVKMRGIAQEADVVPFRIDKNGFNFFLKIKPKLEHAAFLERLSTGISGLDEMCSGGVFAASSSLIAGATGAGKTIAGLQFMNQGLLAGESCLFVSFEESRDQLIQTAKSFGWDLGLYERRGLLTFLCVYPDRLYAGEHLNQVKLIVEQKKIRRCVIDSLSALNNVLSEPQVFRDFTKTLIGFLKMNHITNLMTYETATFLGSLTLTDAALSSMTDNIFLLKFVESEGELSSLVAVLKTRGSNRDKKLRRYAITEKGLVVGHSLEAFEGAMTVTMHKIAHTVEDRLRAEFTRFLGPMGITAFDEIYAGGFTAESIKRYSNTLVSEGILHEKDAAAFMKNLLYILK